MTTTLTNTQAVGYNMVTVLGALRDVDAIPADMPDETISRVVKAIAEDPFLTDNIVSLSMVSGFASQFAVTTDFADGIADDSTRIRVGTALASLKVTRDCDGIATWNIKEMLSAIVSHLAM